MSDLEIISNNNLFETKITSDVCSDITIDNLPDNLDEIELQLDRLKQRWGEVTYLIGQRLKHIKNNSLYNEKGYSDFKTYVKIALKMSENNAYYYISVYDYFSEEQTRKAGSKLKLIIPILNKINRDKTIPSEMKESRIDTLKNELYYKIFNKSYREAEKIIKDYRQKTFAEYKSVDKTLEKIHITVDKITILEDDPEVQYELLKVINAFYGFE